VTTRAARFAPWCGLAAGAAAWACHQQVLADVLRFNCAAVGPARALAAWIACGTVALAAGTWSWRAGQRARTVDPARHFIAQLSALSAGVFFLAIAMQGMASFLVPGCFR
jgi:hypothetical protein